MHVLLLLSDVTNPTTAQSAALERDPLVSRVDISDDIVDVHDVDLVILEGVLTAERFMPRLRSTSCPFIVVADRPTSAQRAALLDEGASAVLHGDVAGDEVAAQIRAIARRRAASLPRSSRPRRAPIILARDHRHVVVLGRRTTLTNLEGNLLAAFMARPNEVMSGGELLISAWGTPIAARSTVTASIRRLRLKIEPDPSHPVFIRTVWGGGYVYRPDGNG